MGFRILVVDNYEPWRVFVASALEKQPEFEIIVEASDGEMAIQKAEELQPDLILLDIGLPRLNGIEVARQVRKLCPKSKILMASEYSSSEFVKAALSAGADGYLLKSSAERELLLALTNVLQGKQFVSGCLDDESFPTHRKTQ